MAQKAEEAGSLSKSRPYAVWVSVQLEGSSGCAAAKPHVLVLRGNGSKQQYSALGSAQHQRALK